jgi:hypothetical protein
VLSGPEVEHQIESVSVSLGKPLAIEVEDFRPVHLGDIEREVMDAERVEKFSEPGAVEGDAVGSAAGSRGESLAERPCLRRVESPVDAWRQARDFIGRCVVKVGRSNIEDVHPRSEHVPIAHHAHEWPVHPHGRPSPERVDTRRVRAMPQKTAISRY